MRPESITKLIAVVFVSVGVGFLPGLMPAAQANNATVVYNLYATDGYIEMADGTPVYIYGFVGGRAGQPFTYQTSLCMDGLARNCGRPSNVSVRSGAPAPTGGPWTGMDARLAGNAQFPAPVVYATVGDVVEIRLKNLGVAANPDAPNDPHSIHLHGMDVDAANDGVPETSVAAVPANLCADGTSGNNCGTGGIAPGAGNVVVYMFSPTDPGTYMYHCHQEADIHVNMGMYGALVVYNPGDPAAAVGPGMSRGGTLHGAHYDKDYILLLSEFDIRGHADEEGSYGTRLVPARTWDPNPYNWAHYKPQYWFINGLSFPQTIHVSAHSGFTFEEWAEAHRGYDPLITGSVSKKNQHWGTPGEKVLIRVINMGFETQPMHMHGYHGKILGSDQRAWDWALAEQSKLNKKALRPFGEGLEKNTLTIGSGETYEWLIDFGQQKLSSTYPRLTETRYDPGTNLPLPNGEKGEVIPLDGDPNAPAYIGGPKVAGLVGGADPVGAGTQYFPFHNHDDYKATNNGVYPGGMFTMIVPKP
jgi:hypothetical protein